jgi:uncharacterized membrane protein HdeD (DUF308 family)
MWKDVLFFGSFYHVLFYVSGTLMIFSGIFYILKTFKTLVDKKRKTLAQTPSYDK